MSSVGTTQFLTGVLFLCAGSKIALASTTPFFGEDLQNYPNGDENNRLLSHPNADAARTDFIASFTSTATDNMESFPANSTAPLNLTFGTVTGLLQGTGFVANIPSGTNGSGRYPISGNQYWDSATPFTITFTEPQTGFGFYATDAGDGNVQLLVSLDGGTPLTVNNSLGFPPQGAVLFWGVKSSDPFSQVTISTTGSPNADLFGFDDFTVPEPASVLLLVTLAIPYLRLTRRGPNSRL